MELCCAIGDDTVDGVPYAEIVETARRLSLIHIFLAAFLAIQHLMLQCKELLSYRVEECISHLAGKRRRGKKRAYRHPEKVRIYTISKAGPLAVSYTHLDVYKRQLPGCSGI